MLPSVTGSSYSREYREPAHQGKTIPVSSQQSCEQLKSWWNFCTQNVSGGVARGFSLRPQGVHHVVSATTVAGVGSAGTRVGGTPSAAGRGRPTRPGALVGQQGRPRTFR